MLTGRNWNKLNTSLDDDEKQEEEEENEFMWDFHSPTYFRSVGLSLLTKIIIDLNHASCFILLEKKSFSSFVHLNTKSNGWLHISRSWIFVVFFQQILLVLAFEFYGQFDWSMCGCVENVSYWTWLSTLWWFFDGKFKSFLENLGEIDF